MVDTKELQLPEPPAVLVDYSDSETARINITSRGASRLSEVMAHAESAFADQLSESQQDAYPIALQIASEYSVFHLKILPHW